MVVDVMLGLTKGKGRTQEKAANDQSLLVTTTREISCWKRRMVDSSIRMAVAGKDILNPIQTNDVKKSKRKLGGKLYNKEIFL